jgi:6-phosphofructokinase
MKAARQDRPYFSKQGYLAIELTLSKFYHHLKQMKNLNASQYSVTAKINQIKYVGELDSP